MSVEVRYRIICDGCGDATEGIERSPSINPGRAYNKAKNAAKWTFKLEGSKGMKHYCETCTYSLPAIAVWHAKKVLTQ
jgi:hypothetical protein